MESKSNNTGPRAARRYLTHSVIVEGREPYSVWERERLKRLRLLAMLGMALLWGSLAAFVIYGVAYSVGVPITPRIHKLATYISLAAMVIRVCKSMTGR
jgi:hypothetical protein